MLLMLLMLLLASRRRPTESGSSKAGFESRRRSARVLAPMLLLLLLLARQRQTRAEAEGHALPTPHAPPRPHRHAAVCPLGGPTTPTMLAMGRQGGPIPPTTWGWLGRYRRHRHQTAPVWRCRHHLFWVAGAILAASAIASDYLSLPLTRRAVHVARRAVGPIVPGKARCRKVRLLLLKFSYGKYFISSHSVAQYVHPSTVYVPYTFVVYLKFTCGILVVFF